MPPPLKNAALLSLPVLEGALENSMLKGVKLLAVPLLEDGKVVVVTVLVVFLMPLLSRGVLWYPKMDQ